MNVGDKVKVFIGKETWVSGTVVGIRTIDPPVSVTVYNVGYGEFSLYKEKEFEIHHIKRYQEQSDAEYNADIERDIPIGLALAKEALSKLLPDEVVALKDCDGVLSGYHGCVTISPIQYDQQRIGGLVERTGWEVSTWNVEPQTRWHPEDCFDVSVGKFPSIQLAVKSMIETIFKLKANDYWKSEVDKDLG